MIMRDDLEQQEQLDELKAFWAKWGNAITGVITLVMLTLAAWNGWNWWQARQAAEASNVYDKLVKAVAKPDMTAVKDVSGVLFDKYGSTIYASLGGLQAAKAYASAGDVANTKAMLQWVADKGGEDEYRHLAKVQLAGVLLDEGQYDEALKVLGGTAPAAFEGLYADRRGDVYALSGKTDDARKAYKLALEKLDAKSAMREAVQIKLDALGEG